MLRGLPKDYIERLSLKIPKHLRTLITDVVTVLLKKVKVPEEEIREIAEGIEQKGVSEMFAIENYDVQETRRIARNEGEREGIIKGESEERKRWEKTVAEKDALIAELRARLSEDSGFEYSKR